MKNRPFPERLRFAATGIREGWRRERSFRTHVMFGVLAAGALIVLRPKPVWWALIALTVALVFALELINSALEMLIDHLHPDRHDAIRVVKDMAAGAVLMLSIASLVVGAAMLASVL